MRRINLLSAKPYRCPEHGTLGSLPCAWPDCPNGVADSQFEVAPVFDGQKVPTYTRQHWKSPLGDTYFTWDSNKLPNWFFVRQTYWNEARRHGLVETNFPDTIYHYTSLAGFVGIVESKQIWLSDFSYLNDSRELVHGTRLATDVIDSIVRAKPAVGVQGLLNRLKREINTHANRICVASFSADDDSLAQWRAYGPIAIGFDTYPLELHVNQASLHRVEYNHDTQQGLIKIYLHHLAASFLRDAEAGRLTRSLRTSYRRAEQLLEILAFFKDAGFRSENEIRLAYVDNPDVFQSLGYPPLPKSFRQARGLLIPYVASGDVLRSSERNFEIKIAEVVLGPESSDLLERGLKEFLAARNMSEVVVRRSAVPLRT